MKWDRVDEAYVEEIGRELRIALDDGHAEDMGDGLFVLFQDTERGPQSVVISADDMRVLLGAC